MIFYEDDFGKLYNGDTLKILETMEPESVDMIVTSPPYWALRDYHADGQLGREERFSEYVQNLCAYFDQAKRVLKDSGTLWVNLGDTYFSHHKGTGGASAKQESNKGSWFKPMNIRSKELPINSLCLIPSRFAIDMQSRGWILRNDIIWHKPNQMPTSVKNRFTVDYEHLFFFTKQSSKYYFEQQTEPYQSKVNHKPRNKNAEKYKGTGLYSDGGRDYYSQGARNKRSVWSINTKGIRDNHFATYPQELIETPIKAGCPEGGVVLDIFMGSGTTGVVAEKLNRKWIGIELNKDYCQSSIERILSERGKNG